MLPSFRERQQSDALAISGCCDLLSPETRGEISVTLCRHPKRVEGLKWDRREGKARPGEDREASLFLSHVPVQVTVSFAVRGLRECGTGERPQPGQGGASVRTLLLMLPVVSQKKMSVPETAREAMSNLGNKGKKNVFTLT